MWLVFALLAVFTHGFDISLESVRVRYFEKHPIMLMWSASLFTLVMLGVLPLFFDVRTPWIPILVAAGACAYFGDLVYYYILDRVDASVTSIVGALLAVGISIGGFLLFQEHWSVGQSLGSILILSGVLFLALWNRKALPISVFLCAVVIAYAYVPIALADKWALLGGAALIPVLFWPLLVRELLGFLFPFFIPVYRRGIVRHLKEMPMVYYVLTLSAAVAYLIGEYFFVMAYDRGPVSLVSVAGNVKPFSIMFIAFIFTRLLPRFSPRELFTRQSLKVKMMSFFVVFIGLGLLAVG